MGRIAGEPRGEGLDLCSVLTRVQPGTEEREDRMVRWREEGGIWTGSVTYSKISRAVMPGPSQ